jgi:hypothetical protein
MMREKLNDHATRERGLVLFATAVIVVMILSFILAGMTLVTMKSTEAKAASTHLQAQAVADAGIEHGVFWLREAMKIWGTVDVFDRLDPDAADDIERHATRVLFAQPASGQIDGNLADPFNTIVGQYDVSFDVRDRSSADSRTVVIRSRGYMPSKAAFLAGAKDSTLCDGYARVRVKRKDGPAGNYGYFISNGGWLCGSGMTVNGSIRANGAFSFKDGPAVNGSPIYERARGSNLIDRANNGGIFAGLAIHGDARGMGGLAGNRYERQDPIPMPNLSSLARRGGGTVEIGDAELVRNGVFGNGPGAKNLFLRGTTREPIRVHGTVVVEGAVMISGYVTGQGSIIAGKNIYLAGNLVYLNPPATPRPAGTSEAALETWIAANMHKDLVGLYARGHIVLGDFTSDAWRKMVYPWLKSSLNRSDEDVGVDRIHRTGDTGEGDNQWTVERYTEMHGMLGLIPRGSAVGDVMPGSGEDVDGDGVCDERITTDAGWTAQFEIPGPLNREYWGGNLPVRKTDETLGVSSIVSNDINNLDGCFCACHCVAGLVASTPLLRVNGAIISRNESIVAAGGGIEVNHDERLMGRSWDEAGGAGKVWDAISIEAYWTSNGGLYDGT